MEHELPTPSVNKKDGWIELAGRRYSQREAVELALNLVDAVRESQDREQRRHPEYYRSENILQRAESKLGQARAALVALYGDPRVYKRQHGANQGLLQELDDHNQPLDF